MERGAVLRVPERGGVSVSEIGDGNDVAESTARRWRARWRKAAGRPVMAPRVPDGRLRVSGPRHVVRYGRWLALVGAAGLSMAQIGPPVVPGFPNVPQVAGTLLSGLNAPQQGRTAIVA